MNPADSSRPEDIVSVIDSPNVTIARGVIDGDNSVSGVGVMFEGNSGGGKVDHVDAIHMGNGAFSSYSDNVSFNYTRSFDNIDADQGRGDSLSNALIWNVSGSGVSITNSTYTHAGNPDNIVWEDTNATVLDVKEAPTASPMSHITNVFDWTTSDTGQDTTGPTVSISISDTALKVGETATASFAFSEAPVGFALTDAVANGGTLSNLLKVDATHYTALFTPTAGIQIADAKVSVTAASFTDAAGNCGRGRHEQQLRRRHQGTNRIDLDFRHRLEGRRDGDGELCLQRSPGRLCLDRYCGERWDAEQSPEGRRHALHGTVHADRRYPDYRCQGRRHRGELHRRGWQPRRGRHERQLRGRHQGASRRHDRANRIDLRFPTPP